MAPWEGGPSGAVTVEQLVSGYGNIITGTGDIHVTQQAAPTDPDDKRNLDRLCEEVNRQWVEGVLTHSLHDAVQIELKSEERPELVENRWERIIALPSQAPAELPGDVEVVRIFEERGCSLLILGEPGGGKTTTMLELCRTLIEQHKARGDFVVPLVLNLSTWAERKNSLFRWLIQELNVRYRVPRGIGQGWLEKGRVLLLLDGLDEVEDSARPACVQAIKNYEHPLPGIVVCCRLHEYTVLAAKERLNLNAAICLKPFSSGQVERYFEAVKPRLDNLRSAVQADESLREMITNPLMLNLMILAFIDRSVTPPGQASAESRRAMVFESYILRMFERRATDKLRFTQKQMLRWTGNLARLMQGQSLTVLLVEQLQPIWLPAAWQRWIYAIVTRLGTFLGLCAFFTACLVPFVATHSEEVRNELLGVLWGVSLLALPGIVLTGVVLHRFKRPFFWSRQLLLINSCLTVLCGCLVSKILSGEYYNRFEILAGVFFGVIFAIISLLLSPLPDVVRGMTDVQPVESVNWSRRGILRGILYGTLSGFVVAFVGGATVESFTIFGSVTWTKILVSGLRAGLFGAGGGAIVGTVLGGLHRNRISGKSKPNEGIRRSLRYGVISAIVSAAFLLSLLLVLIAFNVLDKNDTDGTLPLFGALAATLALMVSFFMGVQAVLRHYAVRCLFAVCGILPLKLVSFLEQARKLIFLRRAGGSYLFVHRVLLEHFAKRPTSTTDSKTR